MAIRPVNAAISKMPKRQPVAPTLTREQKAHQEWVRYFNERIQEAFKPKRKFR